ncbi:hypothetical protein ACU686_18825 [Yinghuangia aomiensis]
MEPAPGARRRREVPDRAGVRTQNDPGPGRGGPGPGAQSTFLWDNLRDDSMDIYLRRYPNAELPEPSMIR